MKKNYTSIQSIVFIVLVLGLIYGSMMPYWTSPKENSLSEFSTKRALTHVAEITKKPHFVGSKNHEEVAQYIVNELTDLGLEPKIQEGYTLTEWGNLVKSKNIIAKIQGSENSKALLLLSHYDSAPHSYSLGASDDASGIATILEGVRAFLHAKTPHKNDIIILFTDAEELGLNGAALFVTKHKWAKDVGLAINFEARGTAGPSYMLLETNAGNGAMIKAFKKAAVSFPVSNSLMYSVYKMLPNDTDLTVFREEGNIQGFNFAFIDDHFNYHTQQDDLAHLDRNSLRHQGSYLMPLLNYFSNANLKKLDSAQDDVYFNIPFSFVSYPFDWVLPMFLIAIVLFGFLIFIGIAKHLLSFDEILKGFVPFLGALIFTGLITFFGWKLLLLIYPQYQDLLNGFTYNGHDYIFAFTALSLSIALFFYHWFSQRNVTMNHYIAPLFIWILINGFIAMNLKGAGFFIIPVFFGLFSLAVFVLTQQSVKVLNFIFCIPALILIAPFIHMFPIGLGLKVLFGSAILTVLTFGLMLPVFGDFTRKGFWSFVFFLLSVGFFAKANYYSGYEKGKAKSNSLIYFYNADTKKAVWATYDVNLDSWTKAYVGEDPKKANISNDLPFFSKYNSAFTFEAQAPLKHLPLPTIQFLKDTIIRNYRHLQLQITPNRNVNRYDIFANEKMEFENFKANGIEHLNQEGSKYKRKDKRVLSYYVVDNEPLIMEFKIKKNSIFDMDMVESSFDLLHNPLFKMIKRQSWMMPTPFILNDAVVIKQKIKPFEKVVILPITDSIKVTTNDSLKIAKDTIKRIKTSNDEN
jgi:hypothetical protein